MSSGWWTIGHWTLRESNMAKTCKDNFSPIYRDFPLHVWLPKGMSNSGKKWHLSQVANLSRSATLQGALPVSSYVSWLSLINWYGYGSIPINTMFSGMNIHLPAILMFTRGTRFWHTAMLKLVETNWLNICPVRAWALDAIWQIFTDIWVKKRVSPKINWEKTSCS